MMRRAIDLPPRALQAAVLLLALAAAATPAAALRVNLEEERVGQDIHIAAGEILNEDIAAVGGSVLVDGTVNGDIEVVGGKLIINGDVNGDIEIVWGKLRLSGRVDGDIDAVMTEVELDDGAVIEGEFANVMGSIERSGNVQIRGRQQTVGRPHMRADFPWFTFAFGTTLLGLILLVLATGLFPARIERMGDYLQEEPGRWVAAPFVGLAVVVAVILVCFALVCTVVGILLVPFVLLAVWLAKWLGLAAFFLIVGRRLLSTFREKGSRSMLGAVVLGFLVFRIPVLIPCIGVVFWLLFELICLLGLGLAVMTGLGARGGWSGIQSRRRAAAATPPPPPAEIEEAEADAGGEDEGSSEEEAGSEDEDEDEES